MNAVLLEMADMDSETKFSLTCHSGHEGHLEANGPRSVEIEGISHSRAHGFVIRVPETTGGTAY